MAQIKTIIDVTVRESGYAAHTISPQESKPIAKALENAGVKMIEVGHSMGVGMKRFKDKTDNSFDLESLLFAEAMNEALTSSTWGMVAMGPIVWREEIQELFHLGIDFLRIVGQADWINEIAETISFSKKVGIPWVSGNISNTHKISPSQFAKTVKLFASVGADAAYAVDTNSSMSPTLIKQYIAEARQENPISIGFHGHDQLGVASYNAITALKTGADFADASLGGYGRGNISIEKLVSLCQMEGVATGIDLIKLLGASRNISTITGFDPAEIAGIYGNCVGYSAKWADENSLYDIASNYHLNPYQLIMQIGDNYQFSMPNQAEIEEIARQMIM